MQGTQGGTLGSQIEEDVWARRLSWRRAPHVRGALLPATGGRGLPHLPGLDAVRAIAVAAVLLFHLPGRPLAGGFLGVDVFFVLSAS